MPGCSEAGRRAGLAQHAFRVVAVGKHADVRNLESHQTVQLRVPGLPDSPRHCLAPASKAARTHRKDDESPWCWTSRRVPGETSCRSPGTQSRRPRLQAAVTSGGNAGSARVRYQSVSNPPLFGQGPHPWEPCRAAPPLKLKRRASLSCEHILEAKAQLPSQVYRELTLKRSQSRDVLHRAL